MTVQVLLSRLDKVHSRGQNKWQARCPSHPDKNPSLSIMETSDGRVLIHCHAGCGAADVLESVGLSFSDVQPRIGEELKSWEQMKKKKNLQAETVLAMAETDRRMGKRLSRKDMDIELDAWRKLNGR